MARYTARSATRTTLARLGVLVLLLGGGGWNRVQAATTDEIRIATAPGLVYEVAAAGPYAVWGVTITTPPPAPPPAPPGPGGPPGPPGPPAPPLVRSSLFAANLETAELRVITVTEGLPAGTPFTLDGTRLAWAMPAPGGGRYSLRLYDLATGQLRPLPDAPAGPGAPVLSGAWLVWGAPQPGGPPAILAYNLDSGQQRTLATYADAAGGLGSPLPLATGPNAVAYVAAPPAGGPPALQRYDLTTGKSTTLHTFGPGETPPARLFFRGSDLFYEQPTGATAGSVQVVRVTGEAAPTVLAAGVQPGSLAVGSALVAWQAAHNAGAGPDIRGYDPAAGATLPAPLSPATAVPAGPAALSATTLVWADYRDERAEAIYARPLPIPAGPDAVFAAVWARADAPVAAGQAARGWLWGPTPAGFADRLEPYAGSPGGLRQVRYYDKARMELPGPGTDPQNPGTVTTGLLVVELISGRLQVGPDSFSLRAPATMPVAGDAAGSAAPSYAALAAVASLTGGEHRAPDRRGAVIGATLDAAGRVGRGAPRSPVVRVGTYEPVTGHNVADVFAAYLQRGGGAFAQPRIFDPLFAVGYPVTEAYWIHIRAGGQDRQVLMQAFQRRVLTYSPTNPPGWQVEMGNVGRHYYDWRYGTTTAPRP